MRFAWIDERPSGYLDEDASPTGCDIALARAAFAAMGEPFEPVHTTFAELLPGLADGRWHVSTGMFITAERSRRAHFTRPIWSLRDGLLTRAPSDTIRTGSGSADGAGPQSVQGYRSLASSGGRLAVLRDQVQAQHALRCGVRPDQLVVLETYEQASAAVAAGEVEAYASVALAHQQHIGAHLGRGLRCVVISEQEAPAAAGGFACADARTAAAIDVALEALLPLGTPGEPSANPEGWFG